MKRTLILFWALTAAVIAAQPAFCQGRMKAPKAKPFIVDAPDTRAAKPITAAKAPAPKRLWVGRTVAISELEREAIRAYVRTRTDASKLGKPNGIPQGLAKKTGWGSKLPDGWQATCVRGKVLTSEVHKHCQPLPEELTLHLPPPPPGTVLLAVDGKIVRVGYPTYEILDTFDVLPTERFPLRTAKL